MADDGIALRALGSESLLAKLTGPADLKALSSSQLDKLAEEIRKAMIAYLQRLGVDLFKPAPAAASHPTTAASEADAHGSTNVCRSATAKIPRACARLRC